MQKQTHIEVMDTQLCENKHISKSWTQNYTKTNTYRSHGHKTIRKQTHIEVMDTQLYENKQIEVMDTKLYENKHIPKSWTHNYTKTNT
jgi:pentose-5-phosphate-3-epimerase